MATMARGDDQIRDLQSIGMLRIETMSPDELSERARRREELRASAPALPDPSGAGGDWTCTVQTVGELLPLIRKDVNGFNKGLPYPRPEPRYARVRVKRHMFRYLSDGEWMALVRFLLPVLRAVRLDGLRGDYSTFGGCNMDWEAGRGLHYFPPLEYFGSVLVRLELRAADVDGPFDDADKPISMDIASLRLPS